MSYLNPEAAPYSGPATYPEAIVVAILAALAFVATIPPLILNYRSRNLPTIVLILGISIVNLQNVVNALLWPNDDTDRWYDGQIYCDIESKVQVGLSVAIPSAAACICRRLAIILSTQHSGATPTPSAERTGVIIETILILVVPITVMAVHILVQPARYYIYGIVGCRYSVHTSWPSIVLVNIWPMLVSMMGLIYSVVIICRLVRHRSQVAGLFAHAKVSNARFAKVFIIALLFILYTIVAVGMQVQNMNAGEWSTWKWEYVHPEEWNKLIIKKESGGVAWLEQWIQIVCGFVVLIVYGVGHDAFAAYKSWAKILGLHRVWHLARTDRTHVIKGNSKTLERLQLDPRGSSRSSKHETSVQSKMLN